MKIVAMISVEFDISQKFVLGRPIDNKSALVQIMAWPGTGDSPLSEKTKALFTDACMRYWHPMRDSNIPVAIQRIHYITMNENYVNVLISLYNISSSYRIWS